MRLLLVGLPPYFPPRSSRVKLEDLEPAILSLKGIKEIWRAIAGPLSGGSGTNRPSLFGGTLELHKVSAANKKTAEDSKQLVFR